MNPWGLSGVTCTLLACLGLLYWDRKSGDRDRPFAAPPGPANAQEAERYWSYVELQFQRVAAHENSRLQVTSFVIGGSVVALGLVAGGQSARSAGAAAGVAAAVVLVNLSAMAFSTNSRHWVKVHQGRARQALTAVSPSLAAISKDVDASYGHKKSHKRNSFTRGNVLLNYTHATVALAASVLPLL